MAAGRIVPFVCLSVCLVQPFAVYAQESSKALPVQRERVSIGQGWKFFRYPSAAQADSLAYDVRPAVSNERDDKAADSRPTEKVAVANSASVLKNWILPTGNKFINDKSRRYQRPGGNPGEHFAFVQSNFDDAAWQTVNIPHDWAINGPFYSGENAEVGGGMGRLPVQGVAWYRKKINVPLSDKTKKIFLQVDGAMSYAMVWLNGKLVGGWPYGYTSWQLDLTPYLVFGAANQLAVRLDNPNHSSRWYPGAGIYRNIWLLKTAAVHVAQWGSVVTTKNISKTSADINVKVAVENNATNSGTVRVTTSIYLLDANGKKAQQPVGSASSADQQVPAGGTVEIEKSISIAHPKLWGPPPTQTPSRYVAVTNVYFNGRHCDVHETTFGIRDVRFDANSGVLVNGEHVVIRGVNQHHDLGALGAAFNVRAAERQLVLLREMGCNAIRFSHNPPAPELLQLTDSMGFLVIDEVFDCWELKKTPLDFHLIFPDWHEQDLRAMIRRDRNHPSVIAWSFGNELGEQYTGESGSAVAKRLYAIVKEEDTTRPSTVAMNYAKPAMPLPAVVDIIGLNYQGEGIRNDGAYAGLKGITTQPQFPAFHQAFPRKLIFSSENASAFSSRGEYFFPVFNGTSAPVRDSLGGNSGTHQVSGYELHSADFGSSADKVFASIDRHPYVAGGFVWSGWDYLGEPTPYYSSRSSYCGILDLAGFKKDRFYLYQSYWRPAFPMAHILPHWNWPDRVGQVTPVHVFTSGDEAELFLNERSLGRKKKEAFAYRLRWDDVKYEPGTLRVVAYKNGKPWAQDTVQTTGEAYAIELLADRPSVAVDGRDLVFVTARITDRNGRVVPVAKNLLQFVSDGGEIVVTDNGDPTSLVPFGSAQREAFNGLCLVIVRATADRDVIRVRARSAGLKDGVVTVQVTGANQKRSNPRSNGITGVR